MAFRWRADDGPLLMLFGSSLSSHQKKIYKKTPLSELNPTPSKKLSGSAHLHYWCTRDLSFVTIAERHMTHLQHSLVHELLVLIASAITEFSDEPALPHCIARYFASLSTVSKPHIYIHSMLQNFR